MEKQSRVLMTDEVFAALTLAATKMGLPLSTFLRLCAIQEAERMGYHIAQPVAD